ncbi:MAG TPA: endonuclease [Porphyromonadaceae bacterium]|nr:endonuclease [Porphyromonadaceae bacterium]
MAVHNELGKKGEEFVANWLMKNGYSVLHRNWCFGKWEIDIVAKKGGLLIIGEVKTRRSCKYGTPDTFVSNSKIRNLVNATEEYVRQFSREEEVRFDVFSVIVHKSGEYSLQHIEDAFYPPLEEV